jgi:hypothetical protein
MQASKIKLLQKRCAGLAASASALRSAGASGVVEKARAFLERMDLNGFELTNGKTFPARLDDVSKRMVRKFPKNARKNWGAARKVLNIFLRDVLYSRELCSHFKFRKIEKLLEVPLDGHVAIGLRKDAKKKKKLKLPELPWLGIKKLKSELNTRYQEAAKKIAPTYNFQARVHLDLVYWRRKSPKNKKLK